MRLWHYLEKLEDQVGIWLTYLLILVTAAQVFFRYVLNNPLGWSEELVRYVFIWSVFWGAAIVMRHREHISVELFHQYLSPATKRFVNILNNLCILVFLGFVIPTALGFAVYAYRLKSVATEIPMLFVYVSLPVGGMLMAIHCVMAIREDLSLLRQKGKEIRN
jgi:TRAP-type C4-dicarboxylate transport system permease small subunit